MGVNGQWSSGVFGEFASFRNGINFSRSQKGDVGVPTVDVLNMYNDALTVCIDRLYKVDKRIGDEHLLRPGDLLFVRSSLKREGVGWTSLFAGAPNPISFCGFIIRARLNQGSPFDPAFLTYFFRSDAARGWLVSGSGKVAITNISQDVLARIPLPIPPLDEQRQIVAVLSAVQRAIDRQERLIALTAELKKALMHKLFTEGTRGEPLKQTEIGPVPKSWTVAPLDRFTESFQYGTSVKCGYETKGSPVLRIPNVVGGHLDVTDLKFGNPKKNELETARLRLRDLLFVRTNGVRENAGRCSMYRGELGESCYFASYLIRARLLDGLMPEFLEEYTRTEMGVRLLAGRSARTADGKFNINTGTLQTLLVPKPDIEEQKLIVDVLASIDKKGRNHAASKASLESLFRALLHKLMTTEIRVGDLDLHSVGVGFSDDG